MDIQSPKPAVHQSAQSCKQSLCADILFLNFNVAFSAIVYTFTWKEGCENNLQNVHRGLF
jgi:hypothetical protein